MPEINLLILDFDGVLTDNKVYVFEDGREAVVSIVATVGASECFNLWELK